MNNELVFDKDTFEFKDMADEKISDDGRKYTEKSILTRMYFNEASRFYINGKVFVVYKFKYKLNGFSYLCIYKLKDGNSNSLIGQAVVIEVEKRAICKGDWNSYSWNDVDANIINLLYKDFCIEYGISTRYTGLTRFNMLERIDISSRYTGMGIGSGFMMAIINESEYEDTITHPVDYMLSGSSVYLDFLVEILGNDVAEFYKKSGFVKFTEYFGLKQEDIKSGMKYISDAVVRDLMIFHRQGVQELENKDTKMILETTKEDRDTMLMWYEDE